MERPTFSVIVPSCGRPTLSQTLESIAAQLDWNDEILLKVALTPWGNATRNELMDRATGDFLLFMDDDDVYVQGALTVIRRACELDADHIHIFRMQYGSNSPSGSPDSLWRNTRLIVGNVSTQMFCVPNKKEMLGRWTERREADFDFIRSTANVMGDPIWHEDVVAEIRP